MVYEMANHIDFGSPIDGHSVRVFNKSEEGKRQKAAYVLDWKRWELPIRNGSNY